MATLWEVSIMMNATQKEKITAMRQNGAGYNEIAKVMNLPLNTIKTFCRRNDLTGDRRGTQPENIPETSPDIDLISAGSRVNSTTAKQPRGLENAGISSAQPVCNVTVSYADEPDNGAVADVLELLTHAYYGR